MKVGDLVTGRHKGVGVIVAFGDEGVFGPTCVVLWGDEQVSSWHEVDLRAVDETR